MNNYNTIDKYTIKNRGPVHTIHILDSESLPVPQPCDEIILDGDTVIVAAVEENHIFMASNYRSYSLLLKKTKATHAPKK